MHQSMNLFTQAYPYHFYSYGQPYSTIISHPSSSLHFTTYSQSASTTQNTFQRNAFTIFQSYFNTPPINPMHSSYTFLSISTLSLHFLIIYYNLPTNYSYFFYLRQQSTKEEKAKVAPMAKGLSFIAIELALNKNVLVKIFQTISPKPFFITPSDTFSIISPPPQLDFKGVNSENLGLSRQFLFQGNKCCRQGITSMSSISSQQIVCLHSILLYQLISCICLALEGL